MTHPHKPTADRSGPAPGSTEGPGGAGETGGSGDAGDVRAVTEAALFEAFGGIRGLVETTVPGLIFITIYTVDKDIKTGAICALVLSAVLGVLRLVRRDTVKHAFSGVFGVGFGVAFAMMTGNAKDFYLPGMLYTLGLALAYLITSAAGAPLLGVVLGPVFKENLSWRTRNPGRKKAYTKASYAWGLILLAKCAVLFPLYWWADTAQFGWVTVTLKIPPFLLAVYLTWIFLAKAPPPINVIAEMEAEEEAEEEAERARKQEREGQTAREPLAGDLLGGTAQALVADGEGVAQPQAPSPEPVSEPRQGGRHRR